MKWYYIYDNNPPPIGSTPTQPYIAITDSDTWENEGCMSDWVEDEIYDKLEDLGMYDAEETTFYKDDETKFTTEDFKALNDAGFEFSQ